MNHEHAPVIIVGGSLVGLSAACFLATHGVAPLLVERHDGTSIHPRAGGFNPRTMELFRTIEIEDAVRAAQELTLENSGILRVESLTGREHGWFEAPYLQLADPEKPSVSPSGWGRLMQNRLEPILRARAESLGARLHFSTELLSIKQDDSEVRALIRDRTSGEERTLHARFLIAADGSKSTVRQALGIATQGPGALSSMISILFQADLSVPLRGRQFALCHISNDVIPEAVLIQQGTRYTLAIPYHPELGEGVADFSPARCIELVRAAIGDPELEVTLHSVLPWELSALWAERVQVGRIFLVGDAAHVMPPTGAFGANAGIQDAHNLAWKLAYVLSEQAGPGLLDTYRTERESVGQFTAQQAIARSVHRFSRLQNENIQVSPIVDDMTVMMGYRYRSSAIWADDCADAYVDPRAATAQVGTRAPHVVLQSKESNRQLSTLDLFRTSFTLLTGSSGTAIGEALRDAARRLGLSIAVHEIGGKHHLEDSEGRFLSAYGISESGAVLVRPDGFIAWRTPTSDAFSGIDVEQVLRQLLCGQELTKVDHLEDSQAEKALPIRRIAERAVLPEAFPRRQL